MNVNSRSLSDLVALCYIDDLLSLSNPPRPLSFIFQRVVVVSCRSSACVSHHTIKCLLSIVGLLSLPCPPRPPLDPTTAASLLHLILSFPSASSSSLKKTIIEGARSLSVALQSYLPSIEGVSSLEDLDKLLCDKYLSDKGVSMNVKEREMKSGGSLLNVLQLEGTVCTQSVQELSLRLNQHGISREDVTEKSVAASICYMLETAAVSTTTVPASFHRPGALSDNSTWKGEVVVEMVMSLNPNLDWNRVLAMLDSNSLFVKDRAGLLLLTNMMNTAFKGKIWTVRVLDEWTHKRAQVSLIHQIVVNPDIVCLADLPHRSVNISCLKVQPEESNKEIANWRVMELMETLVKLLKTVPGQVMQVVNCGLAVCPDILTLSLIQLPSPHPHSDERVELLMLGISSLVSGHTNAVPVLNCGWSCDTMDRRIVQKIILSAFTNFYWKNPDDQSKLTKILDMAHELKPNGLSELFRVPNLAFTLDLACLASKRDFLKLEKWLEDKYVKDGEAVVISVIQYTRNRLPSHSSFPAEVLTTLLSFAHKYANTSTTKMEYNLLVNEMNRMQSCVKREPPSTVERAFLRSVDWTPYIRTLEQSAESPSSSSIVATYSFLHSLPSPPFPIHLILRSIYGDCINMSLLPLFPDYCHINEPSRLINRYVVVLSNKRCGFSRNMALFCL